MTKRERICAVIEGKTPDVTPYYIDLTITGKLKMADYYNVMPEQLNHTIGNDLLFLNFTPPEDFIPYHAAPTLFKDEFGVIWDSGKSRSIGDWGLISHPVKDMDLDGYHFPTGLGQGRFKQAAIDAEHDPGCFNLLQMVGLFDVAWHITGMQDFLMSMASDPGFTEKMLDMALSYNLNVIDSIPDYIDGIRFLEDWGSQRGMMMGLDYWIKYLKAPLRKMYEACRKKGCAVFLHSCGDITDVFPEIIEIGVDVVDPIQPEVMDLGFIKTEYGKDIVLFGGIGSQSTIPLGTPEQVLDECRERRALLADGGKFIMGPSGAIPTEAPVENIAALVEFCKAMVVV